MLQGNQERPDKLTATVGVHSMAVLEPKRQFPMKELQQAVSGWAISRQAHRRCCEDQPSRILYCSAVA